MCSLRSLSSSRLIPLPVLLTMGVLLVPATGISAREANTPVPTPGAASPSGAPTDPSIPARYRNVSMLAGAVGVASTGWNTLGLREGRIPTLGVTLGIVAGASSVALGASRLDEDGSAFRALALANLAAGAVSLGMAIHAGRSIHVEVRPWVPPYVRPEGEAGDGTVRAMGVGGSIRF